MQYIKFGWTITYEGVDRGLTSPPPFLKRAKLSSFSLPPYSPILSTLPPPPPLLPLPAPHLPPRAPSFPARRVPSYIHSYKTWTVNSFWSCISDISCPWCEAGQNIELKWTFCIYGGICVSQTHRIFTSIIFLHNTKQSEISIYIHG